MMRHASRNGHASLNGKLRQTPPAAVAERMAREGIDQGDLLLCSPTDIDAAGRYRRQWLLVTRERLLVVGEEPPGEVTASLAVRDVREFRLLPGVGSGMLTARVDGIVVDVLRYSNREAYRYERVAAKLEQLRQGEPVEIHPEDEHDPRRCEKCGLLLDQPGESCAGCVSRGAVLSRMMRLMRPYRKQAALMMALLVAGIALDLVSPQLTRYLVDHVLPGSRTAAAELSAEAERYRAATAALLGVVGVLAGVQVLRAVVNIFSGRLASRVGTSITHDIRGRLVGHLQHLSLGFYDRQQVGSLVGRVAYDTEALHGFIWQLTGGFLLQLMMVVGVGVMMFSIDTRLALCALLPAPLIMGATVFFWRKVYPRYYQTWDASSKQAGALSGMLSGVRVVKAFSQEARELSRFSASSERLRRSRHNVDAAIGTFNPLVGIVFQLGGWIVWYVGGRDVIDGRLSLGELMAFFGYLWMFYGPLAALPQFTNWLTQFVTQANRIFEILDTPVGIAEPENPVSVDPIRGEITLENVSFGYNRHTPVLRGLNLHIAPGEMVGIVGSSGSGKTTIINLICRFYDVDEGRVLIDGVDVRNIRKGELRRQIGVVLQEPFLFRGSIAENLAYGKPGATPEELIAAAKAGNCHDFIMRQAHGYDTWVGERGAGLSGGERQRVGIARVLLTDPRILILDEATSSVDAESEAAIQGALRELVKGRTTIAIAHRLSTLRCADRILVVDRGRLVEHGPHDELMRRGGAYARLVSLQGTSDQAADESGRETETDGGPLPPIDGHRVRWLDPSFAHIHLGTHGALHVTIRGERIYGGVYAMRCMPVKHPEAYLSLRYLDSSGRELEVGIIRDLSLWPDGARRLVCESLQKRYFVHTIRAIEGIKPVGNHLSFAVETDLGPMSFTIRAQSDRVQDFGEHGKMLLDTDENRYLIPDVEALSLSERRAFRRYVYW